MAPFKFFSSQLSHFAIFHLQLPPHQRNLLFTNQNVSFETLVLVDAFPPRQQTGECWGGAGSVWLLAGWHACPGQMTAAYVKQAARKLAVSVVQWPRSVSSLQGHLFFSPTDFCCHGNHFTSRMETEANPASCTVKEATFIIMKQRKE